MRVALVNHRSAAYGAQLRLLDLAELLPEHGVELTLVAPAGPFADRWRRRGLPWVDVDLPAQGGVRTPSGGRPGPAALTREMLASLRGARRLVPVLRRFDAAHSLHPFAHVPVVLAARLARRPAVVEVVDIVSPGLGRSVLGVALRLAAAGIANSEATAAAAGSRARLRVIHPGVDLVRFRPGPADRAVRSSLGARPGVPLVGIVGRVNPVKGIETVVQAVALLGEPDRRPRLVVVGDAGVGGDRYQEALAAEAAAVLGDGVTFAGRRDDVPEVIRALDVLVNASRAEPFGRSVLEAQASGVAVVGASGGGIPEFVQDGGTGLLVPPGDAVALAEAIERLLGDPALRAALGRAGRRQAEARFDIRDRPGLLAEVYRSVR